MSSIQLPQRDHRDQRNPRSVALSPGSNLTPGQVTSRPGFSQQVAHPTALNRSGSTRSGRSSKGWGLSIFGRMRNAGAGPDETAYDTFDETDDGMSTDHHADTGVSDIDDTDRQYPPDIKYNRNDFNSRQNTLVGWRQSYDGHSGPATRNVAEGSRRLSQDAGNVNTQGSSSPRCRSFSKQAANMARHVGPVHPEQVADQKRTKSMSKTNGKVTASQTSPVMHIPQRSHTLPDITRLGFELPTMTDRSDVDSPSPEPTAMPYRIPSRQSSVKQVYLKHGRPSVINVVATAADPSIRGIEVFDEKLFFPATTEEEVPEVDRSKSMPEINITEMDLPDDKDSEIQSLESHRSLESHWSTNSVTRKASKLVEVLSWLVMFIFPLLFLALAIWAALRDGSLVHPFKDLSFDALSETQKVAASLWPIIFAAIVGQTLKTYASFKVERGIKLITLEQLVSSNAVGGTVKQLFMLKSMNWASVVLLVIWALSPLAGQAILRMFGTYPFPQSDPRDVSWFSPLSMNYSTTDFAYNASRAEAPTKSRIDAMYSSLLLGSKASQLAPQDAWGNVKIPLFKGTTSGGYEDADGWWHPPYGEAPMSGLLGIPIYGPLDDADISSYNVTIDTSYFDLQCLTVQAKQLSSVDMAALKFTKSPSGTLYLAAENNTELMYYGSSGDLRPTMAPGPKGVLHFGSLALTTNSSVQSPSTINYSKCLFWQVMVTNQITCSANMDTQASAFDCWVSGQKLNSARNEDFAPLGMLLAPTMAQIGQPSTADVSRLTDTELYVRDPGFGTRQASSSAPDRTGLANVTADDLSRNLGVLVNTLWMLGTSYQPFLGGAVGSDGTAGGTASPSWRLNHTAAATFSRDHQYRVHWAWLAVLVACAALLLAAAVACVVLERRTVDADFLGHSNTAVSRNVVVPAHLRRFDARDRLARLEQCEVLLQDANPRDPVGRIVLAQKERSSSRLVPGRRYL